MTYRVELIHSQEGYAVGCPELPGCWSQGETEEEAIANIKLAISEYLSLTSEVGSEQAINKKVVFVDVPEKLAAERQSPAKRDSRFKVIPLPMSIPHFTKVEDLLDLLEGPDRR